jgi:hypothetical protein
MTEKISRRNMLKGLTALPLLPATTLLEQAGFSSERMQASSFPPALYVVLHGLFSIVIHEHYIAVVTPDVAEHSYLAGDWQQEKPLVKGEWYRLQGADDPKHQDPAPMVDKTKNAVLPGVTDADMGHSYFLMRLPFPKEIIPIRYVPAHFNGVTAQQFPDMLPMVQILRYHVFDRNLLKLDPLEGWPHRKDKSPVLSLHIFAEPQSFVRPDHAIAAFDAMVKLLPGADLKLASGSMFCPPLDKNLPAGLDPKLQWSLAERNGACDKPPQVGGQTGTCFSLFINSE